MSTTVNKPEFIAAHAIHRNCVIVARERIEGTWKAYAVPVAGICHEQETRDNWRNDGAQLIERHARAFFPQLADIPYAE